MSEFLRCYAVSMYEYSHAHEPRPPSSYLLALHIWMKSRTWMSSYCIATQPWPKSHMWVYSHCPRESPSTYSLGLTARESPRVLTPSGSLPEGVPEYLLPRAHCPRESPSTYSLGLTARGSQILTPSGENFTEIAAPPRSISERPRKLSYRPCQILTRGSKYLTMAVW